MIKSKQADIRFYGYPLLLFIYSHISTVFCKASF